MGIPMPDEWGFWGKWLGEAFGGPGEKYSNFISLEVTMAANYFFLPPPCLKRKWGVTMASMAFS